MMIYKEREQVKERLTWTQLETEEENPHVIIHFICAQKQNILNINCNQKNKYLN